MRLTAELLAAAPAYMNPLKQREINLRGFKIAHIENLGVTNDEYEVIDLSDNEVTKLDNLPTLARLTMLLLSNNRINKVAIELHRNMPKLDALVRDETRQVAGEGELCVECASARMRWSQRECAWPAF